MDQKWSSSEGPWHGSLQLYLLCHSVCPIQVSCWRLGLLHFFLPCGSHSGKAGVHGCCGYRSNSRHPGFRFILMMCCVIRSWGLRPKTGRNENVACHGRSTAMLGDVCTWAVLLVSAGSSLGLCLGPCYPIAAVTTGKIPILPNPTGHSRHFL